MKLINQYTYTTEQSIIHFKEIAGRERYPMLLQLNREIIDFVSDAVSVQVFAQEIFHDDVVQIETAAPIRILLAIRAFQRRWHFQTQMIPCTV